MHGECFIRKRSGVICAGTAMSGQDVWVVRAIGICVDVDDRRKRLEHELIVGIAN